MKQNQAPGRSTGTQPVGRPVGGGGGESRKKILDAAMDVFGKNGYDGSSIREISSIAGMTHGTTYFYFSSKPELYKAAYEEALAETFRYFSDAVDEATETSLPEAIASMLDAAADRIKDKPEVSQMALRYRTDSRVSDDAGRERPGDTDEFLDRLINQAVANGEIAPEDRDATVEAVSVMLWGLTIVGLRSRTDLELAVKGLKALINAQD